MGFGRLNGPAALAASPCWPFVSIHSDSNARFLISRKNRNDTETGCRPMSSSSRKGADRFPLVSISVPPKHRRNIRDSQREKTNAISRRKLFQVSSLSTHPLIPLNATPLQRLQQLRPSNQTFPSLPITHPAANPLMALGPNVLLLVHQAVEELVGSARSGFAVLFDLRLAALLLDDAEVALDRHVDAGFLPGLARGRFDFALVRFPAAFGQHPAFARRGLD